MDGEVPSSPRRDTAVHLSRFPDVTRSKLRELRGDELRKMKQNGMLPLIYAHLFSLTLMREIFGQQCAGQGAAAGPLAGAAGQRLTRPPDRN